MNVKICAIMKLGTRCNFCVAPSALRYRVYSNNPGLRELRSVLPGLEEFRAVGAHGHRIELFKKA